MALNGSHSSLPRNPGPNWGYGFLRRFDRFMPAPLAGVGLAAGTWVAVLAMPKQRRYSRDYLAAILPRRPGWRDVWRHFFAYTQMMMARIRAAETGSHACEPQPGFESFCTLMRSGQPALLGTFHVGTSDLLGFLVGTYRRRVHMIRLRVDNSHDTRHLAETFGEWVTYVWVNQKDNLLFVLKDTAQRGGTIAMMCDRVEYSSKLEPFRFLGASRLMPFTIYHLALVFDLPVVFSLSLPSGPDRSRLYASPVFQPDPREAKSVNLARARGHFQQVLDELEALLRAEPYQWFNFIPLSPALPSDSATAPASETLAALAARA